MIKLKLTKNLLYWAMGAVVILMIAFSFVPKPVPQDFAQATKNDIAVTIHSEGKTRVRENYVVSAPFAGHMLRLESEPGDIVIAGVTVVAIMEPADPSLLDARSLAQAEARISAADAALDMAQATLTQREAEFNFAVREMERAEELFNNQNISTLEKEKYELSRSNAQSLFASATSAEQMAEYELDMAKAALIPPSERTSGSGIIEVKAPVSGVVLRLYQESEGVVLAGKPLLSLGDQDDLEIVVDMLSIDVVKLEIGDRAIIDHWGGDAPLDGVVRLVEPSGFTKISALGIEEQRVNVLVDITSPPENWQALGDGYRVEVFAVIDEIKNILSIPVSSLFRHQGNWSVFKVIDGEAVLTSIEIGLRNNQYAQIINGLNEGDTVITHPSNDVVDGTNVVARKN
ncbi:MAG: HlyD family efflux transporter periplasmic adaptor subunit [Sphingomonadales bacterium]|nr:HlyD family efflux transporter periplasmic adaptor subunit [Sphingomonadales bacterium]